MRLSRLALQIGLSLSLLAMSARAEGSRQRFTFDRHKLQFDRQSGRDVVRYGEFTLTRETALPQLPEGVVHLAIPPGKDIAGVRITRMTSDTLAGQKEGRRLYRTTYLVRLGPKLDRIPGRLYTAAARAIAAERRAFMQAFFERLDAEMTGQA